MNWTISSYYTEMSSFSIVKVLNEKWQPIKSNPKRSPSPWSILLLWPGTGIIEDAEKFRGL